VYVLIAKMILKPSREDRFKVELQWHVAVGSRKQTQIEVVVFSGCCFSTSLLR